MRSGAPYPVCWAARTGPLTTVSAARNAPDCKVSAAPRRLTATDCPPPRWRRAYRRRARRTPHPAPRDVHRPPHQARGWLAVAALGRLDAGQRLHELIVRWEQRAGAVLAEAADKAVDHVGADRPHRRLVVPEPLGQPDPRVVVHHVAPAEEPLEHGGGIPRPPVEGPRPPWSPDAGGTAPPTALPVARRAVRPYTAAP